MQFSDTTNKFGLIQDCEFWTGIADGGISGNATLLKLFTARLNIAYAKYLAKAQLLTGKDGVEDTNYTSQQFSTFTLNSGVHDYQFLTDQAGNTISDITGVHILPSATATDYVVLDKLTLSDADAQFVMSPNTSDTGIPTCYIEKNNTVFLNPIPNYTLAAGGKLFYRLVPSYFSSSDTTKAPGFAEPFHRLLPLDVSHSWIVVNKPDQSALITRVEAEQAGLEQDFEAYMRQKNPTRIRMAGAVHNTR